MTAFQRLGIWHDPQNLDGPGNMATDEALLRSNLDTPVLRIYGWARPTLSIGYFQVLPETEAEVVRRWTGGGFVDHRNDRTYSLMVPRSEPFAKERAQHSYVQIHAALRQALAKFCVESRLADESRDADGFGCFAGGWAAGDLLVGGRKIAGAAQRRSRSGLLHQGSVQHTPWPEGFWEAFASELADEVAGFEPGGDFPERVRTLRKRYASADWRHRFTGE